MVYLGIRDSCVVGESPRTVRDDGEEERSDRGPIGPRNQRRPLYWASVMVVIGLGREVGAVSYGLVSRLLGGAGTVQVGSGSA